MAEILGYLLQKDGSGWKLAGYTEYDGTCFKLENGEMVSKHHGFIASTHNILGIADKRKMQTFDDIWDAPYDADMIMKALKKIGYCLDHEWRVRRFMREPFTKITRAHIMPMIEIHKQYCQSKNKSPEAHPVNLGWHEDKIAMAFIEQGSIQIALLPTHEGGEFCTYKDRLGNTRFVLKFGDWYAYPREQNEMAPQCTLVLAQYIKDTVPVEGNSVEEFLGKDQFLTPEGILVGKGSYFNFSIDDFLKGV